MLIEGSIILVGVATATATVYGTDKQRQFSVCAWTRLQSFAMISIECDFYKHIFRLIWSLLGYTQLSST